jgi:hypothetical protein
MAHYAFIDENNFVTEVIVGLDETELIEGKDPETWYSDFRNQTCKRTSYNGKIRKNYAGIGFTYDPERDAFIAPKPFNSWILDNDTCQWQAPVAYPTDGFTYVWNENKREWELVNFAEPNEAIEA